MCESPLKAEAVVSSLWVIWLWFLRTVGRFLRAPLTSVLGRGFELHQLAEEGGETACGDPTVGPGRRTMKETTQSCPSTNTHRVSTHISAMHTSIACTSQDIHANT